jgi:hypothetical protein
MRRSSNRFRRWRGLLCAALFALAPIAAAAAEGAFLAGVEDLPLMPGLAEVAGAATVFDAPQGRIVESYAAGAVTADEIRSFYAQTLPQLGWTAASPTAANSTTASPSGAGQIVFRREGEQLSLEITPGDAATTVRFTLAPQ